MLDALHSSFCLISLSRFCGGHGNGFTALQPNSLPGDFFFCDHFQGFENAKLATCSRSLKIEAHIVSFSYPKFWLFSLLDTLIISVL